MLFPVDEHLDGNSDPFGLSNSQKDENSNDEPRKLILCSFK